VRFDPLAKGSIGTGEKFRSTYPQGRLNDRLVDVRVDDEDDHSSFVDDESSRRVPIRVRIAFESHSSRVASAETRVIRLYRRSPAKRRDLREEGGGGGGGGGGGQPVIRSIADRLPRRGGRGGRGPWDSLLARADRWNKFIYAGESMAGGREKWTWYKSLAEIIAKNGELIFARQENYFSGVKMEMERNECARTQTPRLRDA